MPPRPRAASGIPGLDDVLDGGFPREQVFLVEGDPGAGKTTLGLQFLIEGARQNELGMYVVLSESADDVHRVADSHDWSLKGVKVVEGISTKVRSESEYTLYHPGEVELEDLMKSILGVIDQEKPRRVVIDSLAELRLLAQDQLRYRRYLVALRTFLAERKITALLVDALTPRDDRQFETLCHGIVSLEQLAPIYGGQRRRLRVRKMRESKFRDGYHDFAIEMGGLNVYPRLVAADHKPPSIIGLEECSTGVPELDALVGGGLHRGTSTLVLGPAGCGKSTLATQIVKAAADRGERSAMFLFEELPSTLLTRAAGLGMNLAEGVKSGNVQLKQVDPAEVTPGQFAAMVRSEVELRGARVVVIDSVNGYQASMPEEHFLNAHMHELLAYLNQRGVVTFLVMAQAGLIGHMTQSVELSYLADTVFLLRYFEAFGAVHQAISVVKRRTGQHERSIRELILRGDGLRVGKVLSNFQGIMTGTPVYGGAERELAPQEQ